MLQKQKLKPVVKQRGIVRGMERNEHGCFLGEEVEADLIRPIYKNSKDWWVNIIGDVDARGWAVMRCRELVRVINADEPVSLF